MKKSVKTYPYDFINIDAINNTLTANVALKLQKYIQLNMNGSYSCNFIVFKFFPKNEIELQEIFNLNEALKQANYLPLILSVLNKDDKDTPYYLKIEWPMIKR